MSLPLPTFAFTIPSIHDGTLLKCRLYLPPQPSLLGEGQAPKAAIFAHPYAPFGGCYDDPIVNAVAGMLLQAGYVTGTFNFRGAAGSAGHTSWSAKPELGDYVSFYGFMIHYLNGLMTAVPSAAEADSHIQPDSRLRLILAGYSYGSMIASHLPDIDHITKLFENAAESSAEFEIQLRALRLSSQTIDESENRQERIRRPKSLKVPASQSTLGSQHSSSSILVGGFESGAAEERISRESRRSLDIRKSLDRVREKIHSRGHQLPSSNDECDECDERDDDARANTRCNVSFQVCYLLISPVLAPLAGLATLFSTLSFPGSDKGKDIAGDNAGGGLVKHPSLGVYGSKDFFTSVKKLRTWARKLTQQPGSNFRHVEVNGAGHFWHEGGVLGQLKEHIKDWESSLEC